MSDIQIPEFMPGAPLYREIERKLGESIHAGEWKPGQVLPAEKRLAERYGVSMGTLRKAVDDLVAKGVLIRQQGRGTFVSRHGKDRYLFAFFHIVRQNGHKEYPSIKLHAYSKTKTDADQAKLLGVPVGARLNCLVNLLKLSSKQMIIDQIYLPEVTFPKLSKKMLEDRPGTLYQLYQDEFAVTVIRTEERLRAVKADAFQAEMLGLQIGDPLLMVIRVARSFNRKAIELRYSYINTAEHEYYAELIGNS